MERPLYSRLSHTATPYLPVGHHHATPLLHLLHVNKHRLLRRSLQNFDPWKQPVKPPLPQLHEFHHPIHAIEIPKKHQIADLDHLLHGFEQQLPADSNRQPEREFRISYCLYRRLNSSD
ncbi:hypothetical protein LINPERHAP2_LOCUS10795 [Linum perenne]